MPCSIFIQIAPTRTMKQSSITLSWKEGPSAPDVMRSLYGSAVVHKELAYFSAQSGNIYYFTLTDNKWLKVPKTRYCCFSLAVVNDRLTTVGGTSELYNSDTTTNVLLSFSDGGHPFGTFGRKWREVIPPMPTRRMCAAVVTTGSFLVVAGGEAGEGGMKKRLVEVEVMNTDVLQWFRASSIPQPLSYPQMVLCSENCYICADNTMFSCSIENLLKTAKLVSTTSNPPSCLWTKRVSITAAPGLLALKEELFSFGGKDTRDNPTSTVYRFDAANDSWMQIGQMPTPRSHVLAVALPNNHVIVVGGVYGRTAVTIEIGKVHEVM